jgi:hypothetical protein
LYICIEQFKTLKIMIVSVKQEDAKFEPVTISLTIGSEEELLATQKLFQHNITVPNLVRKINEEGLSLDSEQRYVNECCEKIQKKLMLQIRSGLNICK